MGSTETILPSTKGRESVVVMIPNAAELGAATPKAFVDFDLKQAICGIWCPESVNHGSSELTSVRLQPSLSPKLLPTGWYSLAVGKFLPAPNSEIAAFIKEGACGKELRIQLRAPAADWPKTRTFFYLYDS